MGICRLARRIVWVLAVVALFGTAAAADQPDKYQWHSSGWTNIIGLCPSPVDLYSDTTVTEYDYYDRNGVLTKSVWHVDELDTWFGPAATLTSVPMSGNLHFLFDADGNVLRMVSTGITEKVPLPDGGLFISAGWTDWLAQPPGTTFVFTADRGATVNLDRFCAALGAW